MFAKIVFGINIPGPLDYLVPDRLSSGLKNGSRVLAPLRNTLKVGYVVGLTGSSSIKKLRPLIRVIDNSPIIGRQLLRLTEEVAKYYCCSWGEVIEAALPALLRKGRPLPDLEPHLTAGSKPGLDREDSEAIATFEQQTRDRIETADPGALRRQEVLFVHDLDGIKRWEKYTGELKEVLGAGRSGIVIVPESGLLDEAKRFLAQKISAPLFVLHGSQKQQLEEWARLKADSRPAVALGLRSAVFLPVYNPGLIIVDMEEDPSYKQEQTPHYHVRQAALMRAKIERLKLILGSCVPSVEVFYMAQKTGLRLWPEIKDISPAEVKVFDVKRLLPRPKKYRPPLISKYLQDAISSVLSRKGRVMVYLDRKGFATYGRCLNCQAVMKCPRCSTNLVYHFKENVLSCRYCSFRKPPPAICPECNRGYINYSGAGTEKVESELARIFPQARIGLSEDKTMRPGDIDISVATRLIIKSGYWGGQNKPVFELICLFSVDNSFNRPDFRAAEKTFTILLGLLNLAGESFIIQTSLGSHHCFQAVVKKDPEIFYKHELKQRRQLGFPPYYHLAVVKLRGAGQEKVKQAANDLFCRMENSARKNRGVEILSVSPGIPEKLRGNYYWQVVAKGRSPQKTSAFLRMQLKQLSLSAVIVTVDMDPL